MSAARVLTLEKRRDIRPAAPSWNTDAYLSEYYSRLEPTERHTLKFLHRALSNVDRDGLALDLGCGPTLHHAILLAGHVREVHVADAQPENLRAVRRWKLDACDAHDWSPFTRAALALDGVEAASDREVNARNALTRRRLSRILPVDARRRDPLGADSRGRYDVVTSFFCADSFTSSLAEWQSCIRNITSLLAPGGVLVVGALRRCWRWRCRGAWLPSPCIDERHLQYAFDAAGLDSTLQSLEVAPVPDQVCNGFDSILLAAAHAPPQAAAGSHSAARE